MTAAAELLRQHGITLADSKPGRYYGVCPQCSRDRNKRAARCLGITVEADDRVRWGCNHCGWTGPEKGSGSFADADGQTFYFYRDRDGVVRFRKVRSRRKSFWIERPDGKGGWIKGASKQTGVDTTIIYRADEVAEAIKAGRTIVVVEGEKDCDNLWRLGIAATCNAHGASDDSNKPKWYVTHSAQLRDADIVVLNDNDPPGYAHADAICKLSLGVAKRVRRLDLKEHWPEIPPKGDVSDWLKVAGEHTPEKLKALIEAAPDYASGSGDAPPIDDDAAELERLAKLDPLSYGRARKDAAKRLGVSVTLLDAAVRAKRAELGLGDADDGMQGRAVAYDEPEPWPDLVDGAKLLDELAASACRFTVLPKDAPEEGALWAAHTYLLDATDITPRLQISSPTKGCGKTTFLDWLSEVVHRPDFVSSISAAALYRTVEKWRPTLILDEADSFLFDNEPMRNVLNSGHHIKGKTKIAIKIGDNYEPRIFSTFAPVALGLIGELKGALATVNDRSITIVLQRRKPDEKIESLSGPRRRDEFKPLRQRLMRFAQDHRDAIAEAEPHIPEALYNRTADNWRPLFAIADAAGGDWPEKVRAIALRVSPSEEQTIVEMLIADIWEVFDATGSDRIGSKELVEKLAEMTDRPWPEFGKSSKPITQAKLAQILKRPGIGVHPEQVRFGPDDSRKGYMRHQFDEAFARFLPEKGSPYRNTETNADEMGTSDLFQTETFDPGVSVPKSQKPNNDGPCFGVSAKKEGNSHTDESGLPIRTLDALATWYGDTYHERRDEPGIEAWLDRELRRRLREEHGVLPEYVQHEFDRVMQQVFKVVDAKTRSAFDDTTF